MDEPARMQVALGERSYEIIVGSGLLARAAEWIIPALESRRVVLVSDETVAAHYAAALQKALSQQGVQVHSVVVKAGEGAKQFSVLETLGEYFLA